jgi:hypothetical protein
MKEWVCFYCGTSNILTTRFCNSCNSSILSLDRQYLQDRVNSADLLSGDAEAQEIIPYPGKLTGGLFNLTSAVQKGTLTPERFSEILGNITLELNRVFEEISNELTAVINQGDEEEKTYVNMIRDLILSVQFMFKTSLEEMMRYTEEQNLIHIFNGQRLAQKAELDYIEIMKTLKADENISL